MQPAKKMDNSAGTAEGAHFGGDSGIPGVEGRGQKVRSILKAQLGDDIYGSWFIAMEFDSFDGRIIKVSVPVKFVRNWIQAHYADQLVAACQAEFKGTERVEVVWRQPVNVAQRQPEARSSDAARDFGEPQKTSTPDMMAKSTTVRPVMSAGTRTSAGGLEGSPLDPRYTFDSFVVGGTNRMAHAGATQVAETALTDNPSFK